MPEKKTGVPPEVQTDYDGLLNYIIPFAERMLNQYGTFYPFAAAVYSTGAVMAVGSDDGGDNPSSSSIVHLLTAALKKMAAKKEIRASGICSNGRVEMDGSSLESIVVNLEHVTGQAATCHLTYTKGLSGKIFPGKSLTGEGTPRIFVGL
jgi:hypothetical protein